MKPMECEWLEWEFFIENKWFTTARESTDQRILGIPVFLTIFIEN